uniref:Palmitoyltransferase n=1 Tax=Craspedostauros australis TaxID=1486917 RepID=A0A7R9WTF7_9STRA|mmetsp:Transcript_17082/g.47312  ORF Transcript_17082/g.47312 Transcript_17082/m.47312 type:complete len:432 (+) Transcript_17082:126-1421(+)
MMGWNTYLAFILMLYVVTCSFVIYFCVIADPSTSEVAFFMTQTLPRTASQRFEQMFGKRMLRHVTSFLDRSMQLIYLAVVLGSWVVVFWYIYPWITESARVSNIHKYFGYIIFVSCFSSWRLACRSSPGIITASSFHRYEHYPYDNLLFVPNKKCDTTGLPRIARSKFDRLKYNQNVPRYDHFCGWVYNTIGEENYRWFLLFLAIHVAMCMYGTFVCGLLFWGEITEERLMELTFFDRATGETVRATYWIVSQYLFAKRMAESAVFIIMGVMSVALGAFFGYHFYITSKNRTTNEDGKWEDVKRWYKKQKKDYDEAVKNGLVEPAAAAQGDVMTAESTPEISDDDVTCTPGLGPGSSSSTSTGIAGTNSSLQTNVVQATTAVTKVQKAKNEQIYFDPGPLPKNLYDRGFVENWKEVLFPISLRNRSAKKSL